MRVFFVDSCDDETREKDVVKIVNQIVCQDGEPAPYPPDRPGEQLQRDPQLTAGELRHEAEEQTRHEGRAEPVCGQPDGKQAAHLTIIFARNFLLNVATVDLLQHADVECGGLAVTGLSLGDDIHTLDARNDRVFKPDGIDTLKSSSLRSMSSSSHKPPPSWSH